MSWLSIRARCAAAETDSVTAFLTAAGSPVVTLEAATDELLCDDPGSAGDAEALWAEVWVCALFPPETPPGPLLASLETELHRPVTSEARRLEDQDWEGAVRHHFPPRHFPPGLWIYPSWTEPPVGAQALVELDPGLAFGTGNHPTTALCLHWLSAHAATWTKPPRVLDYGCGSGILAIAALKLGAHRALGVDIDPAALAVAALNALRNEVADHLTLRLPGADLGDPADIILANILARPLIDLAPLLLGALAAGGILLLSGFTATQAPEVARAFAPLSLTPTECDGWVLLVGTETR